MLGRAVCCLAVGVCLAVPASAAAQGAIAFSSSRCDQGGVAWTGSRAPGQPPFCTPGIFVMDDDGSNQRRLTKGFSDGDEPRSGDSSPSWSPAGDRIVFDRQTTEGHGYVRLFVMDANGSNQRRLMSAGPPGATYERSPSWSPLGDLIAFEAIVPGDGFGAIYVVQPDGAGLRRVSPAGQTAYNPTFAPDGVHIVYFGYSSSPVAPQDYGAWVTDRFGATPRRVTAGDLPIAGNGLSFSPSGLYMAVTLAIGNRPLVHAMRTDGSAIRRIEGAVGVAPAWSGIGNALFYVNGDDANTLGIHRLDLLPGATPRALTEPGLSGGRPAWSALGRITAALPPLDELAPLTLVGDLPGTTGAPPGKLPFLAADASGLRRVDAAIGLRVGGRCRFLRSDGKLGARRSCGDPVYAKAPLDGPGWRQRTKKLPKGTYEVRFKATDTLGNSTRKPKRGVVKVG